MTQYRRNYVPGGSYFFTVNLLDRSGRLLIEHIDALREAFHLVKKEHPFRIDAMVVLPEHLHTIWTLPPGDADYSTRWKKIKAGFSKAMSTLNVEMDFLSNGMNASNPGGRPHENLRL